MPPRKKIQNLSLDELIALEKQMESDIEESREHLRRYKQAKKERQREQQIKNAAARTKKCIEKGAVLELLGMLDIPNAVVLGCLHQSKDALLNPDWEQYKVWEALGQEIYNARAAQREAERRAKREAKRQEEQKEQAQAANEQ